MRAASGIGNAAIPASRKPLTQFIVSRIRERNPYAPPDIIVCDFLDAPMIRPNSTLTAAALLCATALLSVAQHRLHNQAEEKTRQQPWMDPSLSPDERADMVLKELTLDEKIGLLHGNGMPGWGKPRANAYLGNGGAGFVLAIPRLGHSIHSDERCCLRRPQQRRKWTLFNRSAFQSRGLVELGHRRLPANTER